MRKSDWDIRHGIENLSSELTEQIALARLTAIVGYGAILAPAAWGAARLILVLFHLTDESWNRSAEALLPGLVLMILLILGSHGRLPGTRQIPRIPFGERAVRNTTVIGASLVLLVLFERPMAGFMMELPFLALGAALVSVRWTMRRRMFPGDLAALLLPMVSAALLFALAS